MLLMVEELFDTTEIIVEEKDGKKNLYIQGVYMQGNVKNGNGRMYPTDILAEAVRKYVKNVVNKNDAIGELNHPPSPVVNPERACHRIVEINQQGDDFIGKSLILDTPMGNIVRGLSEGGCRIPVSSRGVGSVKRKKDVNEVQGDFQLCAVDVVGTPSAPDAFTQGIMEGVDWIWDNGILKPEMKPIVEMVEVAYRHKKTEFREEDLEKAFTKFLGSL